jgi:cell division protein FtsB
MLDFHQKRKVRGILYSRWAIYALSVVVLIVLHSTWSVYKKKEESQALKQIAEEHTEELRSRDADLKDKITRLDTDAGVEEEIRSKFSVAKENEAMVVIVPKAEDVSTTTSNKWSFWAKIKTFFRL